MLAIAHGATVTTWDSDQRVRKLYPYGNCNDTSNTSMITDLCWNPYNGQALATCAADSQPHSVVVTAMSAGREITMDAFQHDPESTPASISFGVKSRYLCVSDDQGHVGLWDLKKKSRVRRYQPTEMPIFQTTMDDTYVYSLTTKALYVLWIKQGTLAIEMTATTSPFTRFQVLHNNSQVAIGTQAGHIEIHKIDQNNEESTETSILKTAHRGAIHGLALLNSQVLASCSADGVVCFTHLQQETMIQFIQLRDSLTSLTAEGNLCAIGSVVGTVQIYDVRRMGEPTTTLQLEEAITTLQFASTTTSSDSIHTPVTKSMPVISTPLRSAVAPTRPAAVAPTSPRSVVAPTRPAAVSSPIGQEVDALSDMVDEVLRGSLRNRPPISERAFPSSDGNAAINAQAFQETVNAAVDDLRDDVGGAIRNLHIDMIRQFQLQNDHISAMFSKQTKLMERLIEESETLREENKKLKEMEKKQ
jgi:WD40 repeat protein